MSITKRAAKADTLVTRLLGASPWMMVAKWVLYLILAAVLVFAGYRVLWYVFGGRAAIKAQAEQVVTEEQGKAATAAGQASAGTLREHYTYRTETQTIVREGQAAVNQAYKGGKIDEEVHAAGAAALCKLHDDLCTGDQAVEVQRPDPAGTR